MTPDNITAAFEERQRAVAALRELADETQGRDMTAEETQTYERQNADIDELDARIKTGLSDMKREQEAAEALETFRSMNHLTTPVEETAEQGASDEELFRQLLNGELRSIEFTGESRDLTEGSATAGGNLVTSTMYQRVVDKFTEEGAALIAGATLLETESGEDALSSSMQSLVDGLMNWGGQYNDEEDFGLPLPTGMAASIVMEESGMLGT